LASGKYQIWACLYEVIIPDYLEFNGPNIAGTAGVTACPSFNKKGLLMVKMLKSRMKRRLIFC
jgi:hypothetical protein